MFDWVDHFDLLCFDFDGLLVNTEDLHYDAYKMMLLKHGFTLPWSFQQYCLEAHLSTTILRNAVYSLFPELEQLEPSWETLRQEKQQIYQNLIQHHRIKLMPGVSELLTKLEKGQKKCCVVTNSTQAQIDEIRTILPELNKIKHWISREHYTNAKPKPDGYLKALDMLAEPTDNVVGFEDTMKGVNSLRGAKIPAVLIRPITYPPLTITDTTPMFQSFLEIEEASQLA